METTDIADQDENTATPLEERKFSAQMVLEHRKLDLEEQRLAFENSGNRLTATKVLIGTVFGAAATAIGGLWIALVNAQSNLELKEAEMEQALKLQQSVAKLELERQSQQQQFEIILQATKGIKRDIAADNLLFFVQAGVLPDPNGMIKEMAERGNAPEIGEVARVNNLSISSVGLGVIKRFLTPNLSRTMLPDGREIIGFNHLVQSDVVTLPDGSSLSLTDSITADEAEKLLLNDVFGIAEAVNEVVRVRLNQGQFDVLVSFASSVGVDVFETSNLLRLVNRGKFEQVPSELRKWVNVANALVDDLKLRRETESELWKTSLEK